MSSDSIFSYDPTDEEDQFVDGGLVPNRSGKIAGLQPYIATQLLDVVTGIATTLVNECGLTPVEACEKIRWATYVIRGKL